MIVEAIGQLLYNVISSVTVPTASLSTVLYLSLPLLIVGAVVALYWPLIVTFHQRIRQVDDLPGPKCTSVILGNIPFELCKSMIVSSDHKNLIISK